MASGFFYEMEKEGVKGRFNGIHQVHINLSNLSL